MAAQNIIGLGFNVEELNAEKQQVLNIMVDLFGKLREYDGTKFNPLGGGGLTDFTKAIKDQQTVVTDLSKTIANLNQVLAENAQKQTQAAQAQASANNATKGTADAYKSTASAARETSVATAQANRDATTNAEIIATQKKYILDAAEAQSRLRKELDAGSISIETFQEKSAEAIKIAERYKAATADLTKELKAQIQIQQAPANSISQAKAQNVIFTQQRNNTDVNDTAKIAELNKLIDQNNKLIDENTDGLGRQKINIGNYTGAIDVLIPNLDRIKNELSQMTAAGDTSSAAFASLAVQEKILEGQLERQAAGFPTVTAELRQTESALIALNLATNGQGQAFKELESVYETAKQKITEFKDQQRIATAESPQIEALASAARGLGGAYALAAGASSLLDNNDEKLAKNINQLIGITTLLNGIEQVSRSIKERGAIATQLNALASGALAKAREVEIALFGSSTTLLAGETAAVEANTVEKVANAEATEGIVAADVAAEAATISLRTALISTGVGAIIIGLIYGITKLVGAIYDWSRADEIAAEKTKALADSAKELTDAQEALFTAYDNADGKILKSLQLRTAADQAAGKNVFINIANQQQESNAASAAANKRLAELGLTRGAVDDLNRIRIEGATRVEALESHIQDLLKEGVKSGVVDDAKKQLDALKAVQDVNEKNFQAGKSQTDILDDVDKTNRQLQEQRALESFNLLQKITADAYQRRYDTIKAANDEILSLDVSTQDERTGAVEKNYQAEVTLEQSKEKAIRELIAREIITEKDGDDQIKTLRNDLVIAQKASADKLVAIQIEYYDRIQAANLQIRDNGKSNDAVREESITKDVQKELNDRLSALKQSIANRTAVIIEDYNEQVRLAIEHGKTAGQTEEQTSVEILAIESNRDKELVALTADTAKKVYDITISSGEARLKAIEDTNKAIDAVNNIDDQNNKNTTALDSSLLNEGVTYRKYLREKRDQDAKYIADRDAAEVSDDEKRLANLEDYLNKDLNIKKFFADQELAALKNDPNSSDSDIAQAQSKADALAAIQTRTEAAIAEARRKLNRDLTQQEQDRIASTIKGEEILKQRSNELAEQTFSVAKDLVDAAYENRITKIQRQVDIQDKASQAEIDAVGRSTLSDRDRAAETAILTAQQNARDAQARNEIRQEKVKEAKFDRDIALAEIAWNTAKAIVKDTAGIPWPLSLAIGITDAAIGAVQAAAVLARPIPSYAEGTDNHPGGWGLTGEGKFSEAVIMPGRDPIIVDKPTYLNMPAGTEVVPLDPSRLVFDMGMASVYRASASIQDKQNPNSNKDVVTALTWHAGKMEKALSKAMKGNKQGPATITYDPTWERYIDKKVRGKR